VKDRRITRANKKFFRGDNQYQCLVGLLNSQPKHSIPSPMANIVKNPFKIESVYSSGFETNRRKH